MINRRVPSVPSTRDATHQLEPPTWANASLSSLPRPSVQSPCDVGPRSTSIHPLHHFIDDNLHDDRRPSLVRAFDRPTDRETCVRRWT